MGCSRGWFLSVYCVLGRDDVRGVVELRLKLAKAVVTRWGEKIRGLDESTQDLFERCGVDKLLFLQSIVNTNCWEGELELVLLAWVTESRLRIFRDVGDGWLEYVQYGTAGPVCRLVFDPKRQHYNLISLKESTPGKARSAKPPTKIPGYIGS